MPVFERTGVEDDLDCECVALQLTIDSVEDRVDGKHASGNIKGKDYIEHGITFTNRWLATRANGSNVWIVNKDPDDDPFWKDSNTGEALFTANSAVNIAMKQYIASWLDQYLDGAQSSAGPKEYSGEMHTYEGECVCVALMLSAPHRPFPWEEMTNGGQFPKRCFQCSCGNRWYCLKPEDHVWGVVSDPKAWKLLLKYNGAPTQKIAFGEGAYVVLEQTMVENGFMPLP